MIKINDKPCPKGTSFHIILKLSGEQPKSWRRKLAKLIAGDQALEIDLVSFENKYVDGPTTQEIPWNEWFSISAMDAEEKSE